MKPAYKRNGHPEQCECSECYDDVPYFIRAESVRESNPKTLMGRQKVPMLSVLPPASLIAEAAALQYGAYEAPKKDGTFGYGPYNWRDQPIEAMVYIDACLRHIDVWVDGEEAATDSLLHHLWHAKATLGILIDAIENKTWIDDRPKVRTMAASEMLERVRMIAAQREKQRQETAKLTP